MPVSGVKDDSMPEILLPNSLGNQFKSYLIALEHLAIDLPEILEMIEREVGDGDLSRRIEGHMKRINAASKAR